jgi:amidase
VSITALEMFFEQWDALICPVMAIPAFPHCAQGTPLLVDGYPLDYWLATIAYTCPFNLTGHPVVTLPVALSHEGLPIGVQVVGRRWGEMPLLAVAKCISEVAGSFQRPPGY